MNRRKRRPRIFRRKSPWEQPIYLLMRRDGSYVLASCSVEDSTIIVHPYTEGFVRPERLRDPGRNTQEAFQCVAMGDESDITVAIAVMVRIDSNIARITGHGAALGSTA